MDINDEIWFSPGIRMGDVNHLSDELLLENYKERIMKWHISAASCLNEKEFGFGAGIILLSLIDALARIFIDDNSKVGSRYKSFCQKWLEINLANSEILYDNYRNGLIHEGRIKNSLYFSYKTGAWMKTDHARIIINPSYLCEKLTSVIDEIFKSASTNGTRSKILARIRDDFA